MIVNGKNCNSSATTILELLVEFEMDTGLVAVEVNGEVIPKSQHEQHVLSAKDHIEVIHAIGGG